MNRRHFLRSLGIGVAALYLRLAPECLAEVAQPRVLITGWFQTTRLSNFHSEAYTVVLERILADGNVGPYLEGFKRA